MRTYLVTGASTGIGHDLVTRLAQEGHRVFATVRKPEDAEVLAGERAIHPLILDVRNPGPIAEAVKAVGAAGQLHGLVNNAGVGGIGPLSVVTAEELHHIYDVNVLGVHRMTQAFLPLLLRTKGRIVHIGSQGGMITSKYFASYTMTKHALEAYTISLRQELEPHGVRVSIVQPGGIVSAIGDNSKQADIARFRRAKPPFESEAREVADRIEADPQPDPGQPESAGNRIPSPPSIVTDAVMDALLSEHPRPSYLVGTRWEGNRVLHALLERLAEINRAPSMGYSVHELHRLLDEHLQDEPAS